MDIWNNGISRIPTAVHEVVIEERGQRDRMDKGYRMSERRGEDWNRAMAERWWEDRKR